ncbi:MAG: DegT/DnrJ/EryC1/StrS family aminotransferase [Betaproteobacteria bacterium]|nr:MAG: DegT/DnrJ/EryC1/StrS family aminotransferase [Betaproteobacteria bacterium]
MDRLALEDTTRIAFIDLQAQRRRLGSRIDEAISRVMAHGQFIMGPEVAECEKRLASFCGARHVVTCGSGTQALFMALRAFGVTAGDAVFVPSFSFVAPAEACALLGATPVFVDIQEGTFNIDPNCLEEAIDTANRHGLRPAGIISVDLFGQPADYPAVRDVATRFGLFILADAAQSFGASLNGKRVGTLGDITATSFFPAKPLGVYGDGGALFTDDDDMASVLRSIRMHGAGEHRYDHVRTGLNGRMDTIQAAVLIEKLSIFDEEIRLRQRVSERYCAELGDLVSVPHLADQVTSVWAQYTLVMRDHDRDTIAERLKEAGVPTAVYYRIPIHRQEAYRAFPVSTKGLPVTEAMAGQVLSLPMHPYLSEETQDVIVKAFRIAARGAK